MDLKKLSLLLALTLTGLIYAASEPYDSWILYTNRSTAYLIDNDGNRVHTWNAAGDAGSNADILRNGTILFPSPPTSSSVLKSAQTGGRFQLITWENEVIWDYEYATSSYVPHHDVEPVYYTDDPDEIPNFLAIVAVSIDGVLVDKLVELKPILPDSAEIVWEWDANDHKTTTPNDPDLLYYGNISGGFMGKDWTHSNSVSYNRELDLVILSVKNCDEFIIIDHSTTTEEAKGSTGGTHGKGGDILYRWGMSDNYGGTGGYNELEAFHCARWIPYVFPGTDDSLDGGGNAMIFNNSDRSVMEIALPGEGDGVFPMENGYFGPAEPTWIGNLSTTPNSHQGSVQRLPNGNTFINMMGGLAEEMTPDGEVIWSKNLGSNRAFRVAYNYIDTTTDGVVSIEKPLMVTESKLALKQVNGVIQLSGFSGYASVELHTLAGRSLAKVQGVGNLSLTAADITPGIYLIRLEDETHNLVKKVIIQ